MGKIIVEDLLKRCNDILWAVEKRSSEFKEFWDEKPSEKEWSANEVLAHLNLTFDHYFPKIKEVIETAPQSEVDHYKRSWIAGMLSDGQKPKKGMRKMKSKTFSFFEPSAHHSSSIVEEFVENQNRFGELIKKGRAMDLSRVKVSSAIGPVLKFTLPECFEFLLSHEERHLQQIEDTIAKVRATSS